MGKRKGPADYSSMKEFVSELQSSCFYFEDTSGLFPAWFVPLLLAWQSRFGGSDVTPWCWHKGIWRRRGTPSSTSMLYHIWNTWGAAALWDQWLVGQWHFFLQVRQIWRRCSCWMFRKLKGFQLWYQQPLFDTSSYLCAAWFGPLRVFRSLQSWRVVQLCRSLLLLGNLTLLQLLQHVSCIHPKLAAAHGPGAALTDHWTLTDTFDTVSTKCFTWYCLGMWLM